MTRSSKWYLGQFDRGAGLHAHEAHRLIVGKSECHQPLLTGQLARDDWLPTGSNIVADLQNGAHVARRHVYADDDLVPSEFRGVNERFSAVGVQRG